MLLKIITVGKLKDRLLQSRCDEYVKWIGGYAKIETRELPDSTVEKEGEAILREIMINHPQYLFAQAGLIHLYCSQNRLDEAEQIILRDLEEFKKYIHQ